MHVSKYKVLVFDFDGVMVDSVGIKGEAFCQLYQEHGEGIEAEINRYHLENGGIDRFKKIAYFETTLLGRSVSKADILDVADKFSLLVKEKVSKSAEIPGSIEFLKYWYRKLPCYVNSATPTLELIDIINERGWKSYFSGVYGSPRSKVDNIKQILFETNVQPEDILFFGDAAADLAAARKSGVNFCGITQSSTPEFIAQMKKMNSVNDFTSLLN